jgi:hypothetical protein
MPVVGKVLEIVTGPETKLEFESGSVLIYDEHDQDCCEQVYADWEQLDAYVPSIKDGGPYTGLTIK